MYVFYYDAKFSWMIGIAYTVYEVKACLILLILVLWVCWCVNLWVDTYVSEDCIVSIFSPEDMFWNEVHTALQPIRSTLTSSLPWEPHTWFYMFCTSVIIFFLNYRWTGSSYACKIALWRSGWCSSTECLIPIRCNKTQNATCHDESRDKKVWVRICRIWLLISVGMRKEFL